LYFFDNLKAMSNTRKYSSVVIDGYERAASRAMLYPVGFKKKILKSHKLELHQPGQWLRHAICISMI